jgi:hypothetical protein
MPIAIALVAGGLAAVNPCGFPLLPAFLSYYIGADEQSLPAARSRPTASRGLGLTEIWSHHKPKGLVGACFQQLRDEIAGDLES